MLTKPSSLLCPAWLHHTQPYVEGSLDAHAFAKLSEKAISKGISEPHVFDILSNLPTASTLKEAESSSRMEHIAKA